MSVPFAFIAPSNVPSGRSRANTISSGVASSSPTVGRSSTQGVESSSCRPLLKRGLTLRRKPDVVDEETVSRRDRAASTPPPMGSPLGSSLPDLKSTSQAYPSPPITPLQSLAPSFPNVLPVKIPHQGRVTHQQSTAESPLSTSVGSPGKTSFFSKFHGNKSETNLPSTHSRTNSADKEKGHTRSKSQLSSDDGGKPTPLSNPTSIIPTRRSSASSSAPSSTSSRGEEDQPTERLTPPVQTPSSYEETPTSPFFRHQPMSTLPRKRFDKTRAEKLQSSRGNSQSSSGYASGTESPYTASLTSPSTLSLALSENEQHYPATAVLANPTLRTHLHPHLSRHTPRRNHILHRTFPSLQPSDPYIDDFTCAFSKDILHQGRLYLSLHHICFSSNILGFATTLVIPLADVVEVRKRSTVGILPNAILIKCKDGRDFLFASFLKREEAFGRVLALWEFGRSGVLVVDGGGEEKGEEAGEVGMDAEVKKRSSLFLETTRRLRSKVSSLLMLTGGATADNSKCGVECDGIEEPCVDGGSVLSVVEELEGLWVRAKSGEPIVVVLFVCAVVCLGMTGVTVAVLWKLAGVVAKLD